MKSLYAKLAIALTLILASVGLLNFIVSQYSMRLYYEELTQELNAPLAMYVDSEFKMFENDVDLHKVIAEISNIAMIVNPSAEVYLLGEEGNIVSHVFPKEEIKRQSIDLSPIKSFLSGGDKFPIRGDDPRDTAGQKIFSATKLTDEELGGYLYVILGGKQFDQLSNWLYNSHIKRVSLWVMLFILVSGIVIALVVFNLLTKRLTVLSAHIKNFTATNFSATELISPEKTQNDEIGSLTNSFNAMSTRIVEQVCQLKETDRLRRELISNVSHDMRTPLAVIRGYMETLSIKGDQMDPQERQQYLQKAQKTTVRVTRVIDDLFELSKLEAGNTVPNFERFLIAELLFDTIQDLEILAKRKNINIEIILAEQKLMVYADVSMLQRVFENLIRNAIKYTEQGGEIKVRFWSNKGKVKISVEDTGNGISEYDIPYIFNRLYRANRTPNPDAESSGLGLSIVKKILELHQSNIGVKSTLNRGTKFEFELASSEADFSVMA